jgi:hypothetical protein
MGIMPHMPGQTEYQMNPLEEHIAKREAAQLPPSESPQSLSSPRPFSDRLQSAAVVAMAAFMIGATILSSAAGPITSIKAIIARLLVGSLLAIIGFSIGLLFRRRLATICLAISAVIAIPSLVGTISAHLSMPLSGAHVSLKSTQLVASASEVFRNDSHNVSFRFPSTWKQVTPQSRATLLLLYAQNGSAASFNLTAIKADAESAKEYTEEYFARVFSPKILDFSLSRLSHTTSMGRDVAYVSWNATFAVGDQRIPYTTLAMMTIYKDRRYMMIMNVPRDQLDSVKRDFDIMSGTLIFDP